MPHTLAELIWPRRTERLTIRPATEGDVVATWRFRRVESVGHWITSAPTDEESYRRHFSEPARLAKTLVIERGGTIIGDLMLSIENAWAQTEVIGQAAMVQANLGWVLDPAYAGAGYATEAVREMLRICFVDLGLRRVTADCFADNAASWHLMERIGMRRESYAVADCLHRSGRWLDGMAYALLAEEWRAAQTATPPVSTTPLASTTPPPPPPPPTL